MTDIKKKIFVDIDDLLTQTSKAAFDFHGVADPFLNNKALLGKRQIHKIVGMSWQSFWGNLPFEFWATIPKMPWADQLVDLAIKHFGLENVFFLTSPIRTASCAGGKMEWCVKTYPKIAPNLVIAHPKWALVGQDGLLIDDSYSNEEEFTKSGLRDSFYLFPSLQNKRYELAVLYQTNPELAIADMEKVFESYTA